jgi:hypothetical protein
MCRASTRAQPVFACGAYPEAEKAHAHGVRKARATIAAENSATTKQLMAIFRWDSIRQADLYTRAAEQKRTAADAMHLIEARDATEA